MNAGYVRLSRDDDRRNYVSIENQKLIIRQFAAQQNFIIDCWYEDDGVSGYIFDRPGFNQLLKDLEKNIDRVFVKDFSRLGRHNAKVLLLLDEFQERGKQLIVIDDNYDSMETDDDTIGIKTWYNERYVKDTSKKIKHAIEARQKEGTLLIQTPFGYKRNKEDKSMIEIMPQEAAYVKMVYDLYLKGSGYRMIANYLTEQNIPTPSMVRHKLELEEGKITKRRIASEWSDSMVKDLLGNDFYIGTLRLKKRTRSTIHGKSKRVPNDQQYVFENNHPAIIDPLSFHLVQEIREKRVKNNYRGIRGQWIKTELPNPFGSCLFCKDCKTRLTPIRRTTSKGERNYYICNTYNTKGRRYCPKSHLIEEHNLKQDILAYLELCRRSFNESIADYDLRNFSSDQKTVAEKRSEIEKSIHENKKQLKILFAQKIKDLADTPGSKDVIEKSYGELQKDILAHIYNLEIQLKELNHSLYAEDAKETQQNALQIIDKIIETCTLDRKDIEILIERIEVDENGFPEIELKHDISSLLPYSPLQEMNRRENEIIYQAINFVLQEKRGYTSAKYLSKALTDIGYAKSKKNILPYLGLMIDMGIIEQSDNSLKPYTIVKSKEAIEKLMENFHPILLCESGKVLPYDFNLH